MSRSIIRKSLGVFSLAMITAGSVDSVRNLPATAMFGSSLIFFFVLSTVFFLLPSALVSAELASTSTKHGGVYTWVKEAFGLRFGFLAIWFQWIENVIWYPTILSFVAGTLGYLVSPSLAESKAFLISVILCSFWGVTFVNLFGIKSSARFSNLSALFGLIVPMTLIISLGVGWFVMGQPIQLHFSASDAFPHFHNANLWVALTGIILSFCGMEIAAVHTHDVKNPQREYPRAMFIATIIILFTLMSGSLAIAAVLPKNDISLVAGIMQAFHAFFAYYHMQWIMPFIAVMLVVGGMGSVNNWIIAPTRGLVFAMRDGQMGPSLSRENRHGAPYALLIWQAVIVSIVSLVFLLLPSVNGSYWLLTALASQLYMLMYILLFAAAIQLRYKNTERRPGFLIPGGSFVMWIVAGAGLFGSLVTLFVGFIPPTNLSIGSPLEYELLLIGGLLTMSIPPFFVHLFARHTPMKHKEGVFLTDIAEGYGTTQELDNVVENS